MASSRHRLGMRSLGLGGIVCALLLSSLARADFWAIDFWQYFENRGLAIRTDFTGAPDYLKQRPHEWYLATDSDNASLTVATATRWAVLAHLAAARYHQYLGIWHLPSHPVWLRRGREGFPALVDALQVTRPGGYLFPAGQGGGWFGGYVERMASRAPDIRGPDDLLDEIKARAAEAWIASTGYTLGRIGTKFGVVDPGIPLVLERLERQINRRPSNSGLTLPVERLRGLHSTDVARFALQLRVFLDRVETLTGEAGEVIFGPTWDAASQEHTEKGAANPQYRNRFAKLWRGAREQLQQALRKDVGGVFKSVDLSAPATNLDPGNDGVTGAPTRLFSFNDPNLPNLTDGDDVGRHAKHYLESLFYSVPSVQAKVFGTWLGQLGNAQDPIELLLEVATWRDNSTRITVPRRYETSTNRPESPQPFLNTQAPRTLVVYSPNDKESRTFAKILARVASAINIVPFELMKARGEGIEEADWTEIARVATKKSCKLVTIFEMGGMPQEGVRLLQTLGVDCKRFDHHNLGLDDWQKLSAIEQFFRQYGYLPSLYELGVGVFDRSSVHGIREWGYDRKQVGRFISATGGISGLDETMAAYAKLVESTPPGELMVIDDYYGSIGTLSTALSLLAFPNVPNYLAIERHRHSFRFSGSPPAMLEILAEVIERPQVVGVYWGGDLNTTLYAGARTTNQGVAMSRDGAFDTVIRSIVETFRAIACRAGVASHGPATRRVAGGGQS